MVTSNQPVNDSEPENTSVVDVRSLKEHLGFVLRSVGRHKLLAAAVFIFVVVGAGVGFAVLPKTYRVESRLLIRGDALLPSVAEPGRGLADADTAPLRSARDLITARDNLVALVQRTNLVEDWSRHRAPALRVKDLLFLKIFGPVSEKDRVNGLVDFLRRRLVVWDDAGGKPSEGTVTITVEWPDPQMAFRLVEAAQQGFIEARHIADMSAIAEGVAIIESHAANWRAEALEAEDAVRKVRVTRRPRAADPAAPAAAPLAAVAPAHREAPDPEAERLAVLLAAKQRVIADLEDMRGRTLADLQRRLAEQKAIYTDRHPFVISLNQSIAAMSQESPQLTALRREVKDLEAELARHTRKPVDGKADAPALTVPVRRVEPPRPNEVEDPEVEAARARLKFALEKYQHLRARADSVNLELEARRAAFKYRYAVVVPAELPKGPIRPKLMLVAPGALVAALVLAALAAVLADLRAGRLLETWQVEHALKLPVISEIRAR